MFKRVQPILLMLVSLLLCLQSAASAQPSEVVCDQITLRGGLRPSTTPPERSPSAGIGETSSRSTSRSRARPSINSKSADVVTVAYYDRVSLRAASRPASLPLTGPSLRSRPRISPGALPGATVASQRVATVTITGWDPATRVVTFTGPAGVTYTRRLLDTTRRQRAGGAQRWAIAWM